MTSGKALFETKTPNTGCVSLFSPSLVEQNLKCLEGLLIFQNHTYPVVRKAAQENLTGLKNQLTLPFP